jgi:hypothetical protein
VAKRCAPGAAPVLLRLVGVVSTPFSSAGAPTG